jgi:hypothetical protein
MPEVEEWYQGRLDVGGEPGEEKIRKTRRALPIKPCGLCKKPVIRPFVAGSKTTKVVKATKKQEGGVDRVAGAQISLDPVGIPDGDWFTVGKIAYQRRPQDLHPSLVFYVEHDCIAESK